MDAKKRLAAFTVEPQRGEAQRGEAQRGEAQRGEAQRGEAQPQRSPGRRIEARGGRGRGRTRAAVGTRMPSGRAGSAGVVEETVSGSESDPDGEVVDVKYIHEHKPSTRVVRQFMRVQAQAVSTAEDDDFL